jgi:hypothetical protein
MSEISKRFESFVRSANTKLADEGILLPEKTNEGIVIGEALIKSDSNLKHVYYRDFVYKDIYLNAAAIKIATLLTLRKQWALADEIYRNDQEYGKWFVDNQHLLALHRKSREREDFDRADMFWARYQESRDRAQTAKIKVERLVNQR